MLTGVNTVFYSTGKVKEESRYIDNQKEGFYNLYNETGQKTMTGNYQKDLANGEWQEFYPNGIKKWKGYYVKGQKAGSWTYYNEQGKEVDKKKYELNPEQAAW